MQLSLQDAVNNVSSVNEYIKNTVAEVKQQHNMKETAATNGPEGTVSKKTQVSLVLLEQGMRRLHDNVKNINEEYLGDIDLLTLLTTLVENLHAVSHLKNETFTALQYAQDFGTISKESIKRTTKWGAKYFTHEKSYYPVPISSMELGDVNVVKPPPVVSIDPQIETAMKELVDRYRPVRQRTVRSETTKDKAGALPPAVYSSQPSYTKVIFHEDVQDDSENREGIEQNTRMPPSADHDHGIAGITFVDESVVAVVAVADMTDLPVQEDEYDTDSESDVDDDTPSDITISRAGRAIRAHFRLDL